MTSFEASIAAHVREQYRTLYQTGAARTVNVLHGRDLARELGYAPPFIDLIPDAYWDFFHPCGNPASLFSALPGTRGLNLGCGVAVDSLLAAAHTPGLLEIVNVDVVAEALPKGRCLARDLNSHAFAARSTRLHWIVADGRHLPFPAGAFDWILMNGVFNIFADKKSMLTELARILNTGGVLVVTDLFVTEPLPDYYAGEPDAWGWCLSGALTPMELSTVLENSGFRAPFLRIDEEADLFGRLAFTAVAR